MRLNDGWKIMHDVVRITVLGVNRCRRGMGLAHGAPETIRR